MKQWKSKWIGMGLMSLIPLLTSGCASSRGENVSYAIWNQGPIGSQLQKLSLNDGKGGEYASVDQTYPRAHDNRGWQNGGRAYAASLGGRVPDYVFVSWRKMPKDGQEIYGGDLVGPFKIALRSRIPAEVLEKVQHDGYWLEIGVSAGVEPILVRWKLDESGSLSGQPGIKTLRRGGDW